MNELMNIPDEVTMTTVEIAKLTGKTHYNVMRDAKAMMVEM